MRLKRPNADLSFPSLSAESKELCKKSFKVKLITPLYGGGTVTGQPDEEMPVRASAIRGQLRFWWRILNPGKTLKDEMEIWGGMSNSGAVASRVILKVSSLKPAKPVPESCAEYKETGGKLKGPDWQHGIPGYALFPGQGQLNKARTYYEKDENGVPKKPSKVILPPLKFTIHIKITGENSTLLWEEQIMLVLRWWASFGGLGARTRRGLGSIEIENLEAVTDVSAVKDCKLVCLDSERDAVTAWETAVGKLRDFRQGTGDGEGRNPGSGTPERSRWPEADSIREITGRHHSKHKPEHTAAISFPRAVLGLPIITHFKDEKMGDPADTNLSPVVKADKKDRMASPLILKAMRFNKGGYKPIALLLPHEHTKTMHLRLEDGERNLLREMSPAEWWPKPAQNAMRKTDKGPLNGRSGDVLLDFLDFFKEQK